jgi:hypothetical protein
VYTFLQVFIYLYVYLDIIHLLFFYSKNKKQEASNKRIYYYLETAGLIFITMAPTIANNNIRDVIISHKK